MTAAGSESNVFRVRSTALLAGGSVGLLVGASYVGVLTSFGSITNGLRSGTQTVTAGALVLGAIGFGVMMPFRAWARRTFGSERRALLAGATATLLALLVLAVLIDAITGSRGLAAQIILAAGLVCAIPAWLLASVGGVRKLVSFGGEK